MRSPFQGGKTDGSKILVITEKEEHYVQEKHLWCASITLSPLFLSHHTQYGPYRQKKK